MGDKFDGTLAAGRVAYMQDSMDITDAVQTLSLHETLVTKNEAGDTVLLRAVQNPASGGIMMVREASQNHSTVMQETIRRSQMTSMLTDEARCAKYNDAIKRVLESRQGARVLDIGTGTGLLAMLAAKAGASHVTAVEMFEPLADLAKKVVQANNLQDKVSVVCASSLDISADDSAKEAMFVMERKADVLVTEIFDSALLGENCIPAIRHAHASLLAEGATIIPARARLYATVIRSDFFRRFRNFSRDFPLRRDAGEWHCKGGSTGIPVHLDGLREGTDYELLTEPFEVFEFDFTASRIPRYRQSSKSVAREKSGPADAVLTWWELDLTESGDIVYSTRCGAENWQDHWLQVVYPLAYSKSVLQSDDTIPITVEHDEESLSFALGLHEEPSLNCQCGFHSVMTPYRIHEIGDQLRLQYLTSKLKLAIQRVQGSGTANPEGRRVLRCIDISDNSVCAILASRIECEKSLEIFSAEEDNELSSFLFNRIARNGKAANNEVFVEYDPLSAFIARELEKKESVDGWEGFDVIMSEPYTRATHAFPIATLGNLMVQRQTLSEILNASFSMVPFTGSIQAQLVRFPRNTIQKSFITIDNVQGLDFQPYSRLLQEEEWDQSQRRVSLPLFQYNVTPCSERACIAAVNFTAERQSMVANRSDTWIAATDVGDVDAVALSVEYDGAPIQRVARSEIVWLSNTEKELLSQAKGLNLTCEFLHDTGVWDIHVEVRQEVNVRDVAQEEAALR